MGRWLIASIVLLGGVGWPALAVAQEDAVESARQALRATRQPWYDPGADEVRRLTAVAEEQPRTRGDWRPRQRAAQNWKWGGGSWSWFGETMKLLGWCVLIALLGLLIYALVQAYLNLNPGRGGRTSGVTAADEVLTDEQRIENLPVQLRKTKGDFLSIAQYHYQAGNFGEAIVYLFSHRLLQLDKAGLIRLTKGKTNRQYLMEMRTYRDLQKILGQTMGPFEDVFFGKYELTQQRFENCWSHNDQFQLLIQQVTP